MVNTNDATIPSFTYASPSMIIATTGHLCIMQSSYISHVAYVNVPFVRTIMEMFVFTAKEVTSKQMERE